MSRTYLRPEPPRGAGDRTLGLSASDLGLGDDVEVIAELGRGAQTAVYRIRRAGVDYALKLLPARGSDEASALFAREAALLARVDHPGVPQVFDVGSASGHPYLVMEYIEGQPLSARLEPGGLEEATLARLAADVAAALGAAHRAGLVHRDIKPANIIVTPSGRARLIDFGLAAAGRAASAETAAVGTFDYSAPEQTGMLARPVDARADLYALGVVLFQAATGALPFRADDVGELLAMHAAMPAPEPRELRPGLSPQLAELIGRLLAKDPDDRVQTAGEVYTSLSGLVPLDAAAGWPAPSAVTSLVGRVDEQERLAERWRRARSGSGGAALIIGAAGGGKSTLARAVADVARADGALVLTGKCDLDSALPLAPLRAAIAGHLRAVTALPAQPRAEAVRRLRTAAGAGASLLRPLSAALAAVLDAPQLVAGDRHDEFAGAVASFLAGLARESGGLLLVLDDVQWMDAMSRSVLRRVVDELREVPLLLLATARDDEACAEAVAGFRADAGARLDLEVALGPLDQPATARLVGSYLAGPTVDPGVSAEIAARGHGNPFTTLEYMNALIEAGALYPRWGTWRVDNRRLRALRLPSGVLDLVLTRIGGLGARSREALTVAAVLGTVFDAGPVAGVVGSDPTAALTEAIDRGLLYSSGSRLAFVHDRLREALLSALSPADLREHHQRIALVLERGDRTEAADLYAIAHHYANGVLTRTPERAYAACRAAGQLALEENAPADAGSFLESAAAAADLAGIVPDSRFREALGVAYWSTGRLADAREQLDAGLADEPQPLRRAALLLQLAHVLRSGWDLTGSLDRVRQGLAELGTPIPGNPVLFGLATARTTLRWLVTGSPAPSDRPVEGEPAERLRLHTQLCRAGYSAAVLNLQTPLAIAFHMRPVPNTYRLGPTQEYATQLAGVGGIAGAMRLRKRRDRIFARAFDIATALGDPKVYAYTAWMEQFSRVMGGEADIEQWTEVSESHRRWLELDFYTNILLSRCRELLAAGHAAQAHDWHQRVAGRVSAAATDTFPAVGVLADMIAAMLGRSSGAPVTLAARAAEPVDVGRAMPFALGAVQTAVEQDDLGTAFEAAVSAFHGIRVSPRALFAEYRMTFAYEAYGRLTQARRATGPDRRDRLAAAAATIGMLGKIANDPLLRAHHRVLHAGLRQLHGEHHRALTLLNRAGDLLVTLDAPLVHYEAARVRARALLGLDRAGPADQQAEVALLLARKHGWTRRARWVRDEFKVGDEATARSRTYARSGGSAADPYRRRLEALQQVSAAAATVLEPQQLARVALDETLRLVGAERAILFLNDEDGTLRPAVGRGAGNDLSQLSGYSGTLVERVATDRRPLIVTGTDEGAALGSESTLAYGLRSIMIAPLELDGRLLGVVYLDSRVAKGVFTDDDVAILTAVASHIAGSLATARAAQLEVAVHTARQQRDTAEVLREAMNQLTAVLDPDEVLRRLRDIVGRAIGADRVCLAYDDGTGAALIDGGETDPARLDLAELAGPSLRTGTADEAPPAVAELLGDGRSWLTVPLTIRGHGSGVLLAGSRTAAEFSQAQLDIASALAGQGATAYDNARLFAQVQELATVDGLTQMYNRRHFTELATRELDSARRSHRAVAALMIDIDNFKSINDRYGHATGDDVIRAVSGVLRAGTRGPDVLGRYGGEEFALVMPDMPGDPVEAAERLRAGVEALVVPAPRGPITVTVSIGVAEIKPDDDLESLLVRADQALYRAKESGRNQVKCG
ncbi:MAG TPA: diguanylate cyclase [Actinoplanes sp.]|nr:diguanylate cyclase [Actinoplanes sp.]